MAVALATPLVLLVGLLLMDRLERSLDPALDITWYRGMDSADEDAGLTVAAAAARRPETPQAVVH